MRKVALLLVVAVIMLGIFVAVGCRITGILPISGIPGNFKITRISVTPSSSETVNPFSPTAAYSGGDSDKIYICSKLPRVFYEETLVIRSAFTPDKFIPFGTLKEYPNKEYQHGLDEFTVLSSGIIIGYSSEASELVVFSKKGEILSRIEVKSAKSGILLAPYNEKQFFFANKNEGKFYLMDTSGKVVFDLSKATIWWIGKVEATDKNIDPSQFEEFQGRRDIYVRTSTDQILKLEYTDSQGPANIMASVLLDGFPCGKLVGFAVDALEDLFIAYRTKEEDKLEIAMVISKGEKKELRIFHERPINEVPRFFKMLTYRGFLILVEGDNKLRITIYPIRWIKKGL